MAERRRDPSKQPVEVFKLTTDTCLSFGKGVLWVVSRADADRLKADPRSRLEAHPDHILTYSSVFHPDDWFEEDDGYYSQLLEDHGVTVLDSLQLREESGVI